MVNYRWVRNRLDKLPFLKKGITYSAGHLVDERVGECPSLITGHDARG